MEAVPIQSSNWAGYEVSYPAGISYVQANWKVPMVKAPTPKNGKTPNEYAITWVGVDGYPRGNPYILQIGTMEAWYSNESHYFAWYQVDLGARSPAKFLPLPIKPGDQIGAYVYNWDPDNEEDTGPIPLCSNCWDVGIWDNSTGKGWSYFLDGPDPGVITYPGTAGRTAEWVQEAPVVGGVQSRLAPTSLVTFTGVSAVNDNIGNPQIVLPSQPDAHRLAIYVNGIRKETPSSTLTDKSCGPDTDMFSVAYGAKVPPPPTSGACGPT
jgi:hypothetical protein